MEERRVMNNNYPGRYPEEGETREETCERCGHVGLDESDGFYYCHICGAQAADMIVTHVQNDFYISPNGRRRRIYAPFSPSSFFHDDVDEAPKLEDCWKVARERYVRGLRATLQMQTRALVEVHKVDFRVRRVADVILLKYLTRKGIILQHSPDGEVIILDPHTPLDREGDCTNERASKKPRRASTSTDEAESIKRACTRRLKKLREALPMSTTLVVSFVACHELREPILPTDILDWALQGTLPLFNAHLLIENRNKALSSAPPQPCPISYIEMFHGQGGFIKSANELEPMAAALASEIRMYTPPVNFQQIASRFLRQLDIPHDIESILKFAVRLYDWMAPPELWLSTHEAALPTRVAVMSMLIASMAYLYDLNQVSGTWERSLSKSDRCRCPASVKSVKLSLTPEELLIHLEAVHSKIRLSPEYLKDLSNYHKYTEEMGFAGWNEEEELIGNFLDYYLNDQDPIMWDGDEWKISSGIPWKIPNSKKKEAENSPGSKRIRQSRGGKPKGKGKSTPSSSRHEPSDFPKEGMTQKDRAISMLKEEMKDRDFYYVPPGNPQGQGYIYRQREEKGASTFPADADYYIVLRACAVVAKVDVRIMHLGVRCLARRVAAMNQSLHVLEILSLSHA